MRIPSKSWPLKHAVPLPVPVSILRFVRRFVARFQSKLSACGALIELTQLGWSFRSGSHKKTRGSAKKFRKLNRKTLKIMHNARAFLLALAFCAFAFSPLTTHAAASQSSDQAVAGWVEHVTLPSFDRRIVARLDTGAKTSSIFATDVETEERNGRTWVRFTVPADDNGEALHLEKPVRRTVLIKRGTDEYDRRYVVDMEICFNGGTYKTQVNLADRAHLNYPMLLGRRFLKRVALVHSGQSFITEPTCGDAD